MTVKFIRKILKVVSGYGGSLAEDPRDQYISRVVTGRSFADVGGLWGIVNEKVSVAHHYGATKLAMIDITPPKHELWQRFDERCHVLKIPEVQRISSDVAKIGEILPSVHFDVVHCSGVLYHMPDPMRFLLSLKQLTR
jgi:2-polyprenyl-3-methyl-5-hydroxy-6-metoxy-1,4-benzoquinol methylase